MEFRVTNERTKHFIKDLKDVESIKNIPCGWKRVFFKNGGNAKIKKGYRLQQIEYEE